MKIFIDIGHPAHVHYFRNFIEIMANKNHKFLITSRNKEITFDLLNNYKIPYINRGKGGNGLFGKFFYMIKATFLIYKLAQKFKPDLFFSFGSPYAAQASKLYGKPHIALDDTEHAKFILKMYSPFTDVILNPSCFKKKMGRKQIFFNSYMELCALHPNYFSPNPNVLKENEIFVEKDIIFLRFVSWNANHDIGQSGLSIESKLLLVKELSKYGKILISAEGNLPKELEAYRVKISPEKIHDLLYYTKLYIGEGATMASECAMLGTPAIYVNSLDAGTLQEQEKLGLLFQYRNSAGVLEKAIELLQKPNLKEEFQLRRQKMLEDKIEMNSFMVWFVENYPNSAKIMKENPDYQNKFIGIENGL